MKNTPNEEKEETMSNDVNSKENVPKEEQKPEVELTGEEHQGGVDDASIRNSYLSFYKGICTLSLIAIPLFYMYARFEYIKTLMILKNYNKDWYDDGFIIDGWFSFILQPDLKSWFEGCALVDSSPIGMDIIPFIFSFMGVLAIKKIISLLFVIDDRTYSLK
jgi:hypothetical protein